MLLRSWWSPSAGLSSPCVEKGGCLEMGAACVACVPGVVRVEVFSHFLEVVIRVAGVGKRMAPEVSCLLRLCWSSGAGGQVHRADASPAEPPEF